MENNQERQEQSSAPNQNSGQDTGLSRRQFTRAGLIATPVIMTLASRPALGYYNCSLSGVLSGNLSTPHQEFTCEGRTPGYWGSNGHFFNSSKDGKSKPVQSYTGGWPNPVLPTTKFHDIFTSCTNLYGQKTFIEVIDMQGNQDIYQLGQHAAAAYLNTLAAEQGLYGFTMENWGMTRTQLLQLWQNNCGSPATRLQLKVLLESWNENHRDTL